MRLLRLVLPILVAVIGLAAPVRADVNGDDATFLGMLNQQGISYGNADQAVQAGKSVCQLMDGGMSDAEVVKQLKAQNSGFADLDGAFHFMALAAKVYCPKYL